MCIYMYQHIHMNICKRRFAPRDMPVCVRLHFLLPAVCRPLVCHFTSFGELGSVL